MNTRNGKFPFIVSALTAAIIVSACGGDGSLGGGDTAGIGGSGFISSGSVTGFGSVFVNGVEFETGSSVFEIEDASLSQSDLRVGMVVQVEGTINPDGITGTATGIQYSDDIEGPISAIVGKPGIDENADATEKTFSILGKTVVVSRADTAFEGSNFTYDSIALSNVIEVSGFEDQNGVLRASYVELKSITFDAFSIFEVKGIITNLSGTNFTIQGINVDASAAYLSDLPTGLQDNVLVEVKGTYNSGTNTITATEVDAESNGLSDVAGEVELEGLITDYVSINEFYINGFEVDASNVIPVPQLQLGDKIEVEGPMLNGVLIAMEVESRDGNAEVSATVITAPATLNDSFTVSVAGQIVTVQLTLATRMEDDAGADDFLDLTMNELGSGDFIYVKGFESGVSTITATQLKRESEVKEVELQGIVTAQVADVSITVLGVTFPVDMSTTSYEDASDASVANHTTFVGLTTNDSTVIKIVDKKAGEGNGQGIADEVEIEN